MSYSSIPPGEVVGLVRCVDDLPTGRHARRQKQRRRPRPPSLAIERLTQLLCEVMTIYMRIAFKRQFYA